MPKLVWTETDVTECGRFAIQREHSRHEGVYHSVMYMTPGSKAWVDTPPFDIETGFYGRGSKQKAMAAAQRIADLLEERKHSAYSPTLPNGNPIKERIGLFGLPKIGKTHMFWTIAKWHHDLGSDARFYGINTDTSWEVLYFNEQFQGLTNIEWTDASTFQEMLDAAKQYHKVMRPQDWLCTDLQDSAWDYVQDEYARLRGKEEDIDMEDFADLMVESGSTKKYPIEGWDWGTPNARYRILANNYILRGPGHRMIISGQTALMEPSGNMKEDPQIRQAREMFAHLGGEAKRAEG